MTRRETDTSASEGDGGTAVEADGGASPDPDALFDLLVEENVLAVEDDGTVHTTDAFDHGHGVYYDSYVGVDDDEFHEAVAATFGLPDVEAAAEAVEAQGLTREDLARYLALRSELPDDVPADDLAVMAEMVGEAIPDSPVPDAVDDVTDDPDSFVAEYDRAVVSVWKRFCDPCEVLKDDLDAIFDALPDDVAVAGIDGEVATEFCETHLVESAPGFVLLRDGKSVLTVTGNDTEEVIEALRDVYAP